ncbi:YciI family protein [uncultured Arthrobacter sp.]|uniref:YciI family protein n=1 Tax=uncultured Arthrobacter sp. TaxID=114050 RepID=UPI0032178A52
MTVFAVEYVYDAESAETRDAARPAHREWTAELAQDGTLLASGPYTDGAGALLIFKAADEQALNDLLKQDPFADAGAISGTRTMVWAPLTGLLAGHSA